MERQTVLNEEAITPITARRTRGALADLSRQMAGVAVSFLTTPNNQVPSSMETPSSSPEEMVIKLRGQKNPVTWSPMSLNEVRKLSHYEITPPKDVTPTRIMLGLRSSPRKRLLLSEANDLPHLSPSEKIRKTCLLSKKSKQDESNPIALDLALKGLSRSQLINIIQSMAQSNHEVKEKLESSLPEPDLQPILEELHYLRKNVFKSLPSCRLSSKTDSAAYNKASVPLSAFKKSLMEFCKQLTESKQWKSVVEFTLSAWVLVRSTPVWDNPQHNSFRKHCFKVLAVNCLKALKNYRNTEWELHVKQRLERLRGDSEDLELCVAYLDSTAGNSTQG